MASYKDIQNASVELRQCIDELGRLSTTEPQHDEDFVFLAQIIQQLQILLDTVTAGDAREIVFVCSEQIAALGRVHDAFVRIGGAGLLDRIIEVASTLQKESHAAIQISQPQHHNPGKLIHG